MATYYVGIGGNDGNNGTTWALRKLSLNGAEDIPVVAGDTVYVGPGCYREQLDVDVSGADGSPITYIGDVTGENTDDVGGTVRISGSDDDQTVTRSYGISAGTKNYRTFRGFFVDLPALTMMSLTDCTNWIIEDCVFGDIDAADRSISITGVSQSDITIRRCIFLGTPNFHIYISHTVEVTGTSHLVENCVFSFANFDVIQISSVGGIVIKNCIFYGSDDDLIDVSASAGDGDAGEYTEVYNCILQGAGSYALEGVAVTDIIENYNTFWANSADRSNTNVGANSLTYPPICLPPILFAGAGQISGFKFPWWWNQLSEWSQVRAITGSGEPTVDLWGIDRPPNAAQTSWGPCQFHDMERETGTVHAGSVSMVFHDAGRHQIWVPVANESTTITVYVYREANYAGGNPQMIVKQPGQADDVTTDAAAASQWNQLSTTLTPAADPPYVVVELVSQNTAAAGNYDVFFDDLVVS